MEGNVLIPAGGSAQGRRDFVNPPRRPRPYLFFSKQNATYRPLQNPFRDQTMSLRFFNGRIFTTFRAGLALNMVSSPVKGLMP
jgi:hypothetical protein